MGQSETANSTSQPAPVFPFSDRLAPCAASGIKRRVSSLVPHRQPPLGCLPMTRQQFGIGPGEAILVSAWHEPRATKGRNRGISWVKTSSRQVASSRPNALVRHWDKAGPQSQDSWSPATPVRTPTHPRTTLGRPTGSDLPAAGRPLDPMNPCPSPSAHREFLECRQLLYQVVTAGPGSLRVAIFSNGTSGTSTNSINF